MKRRFSKILGVGLTLALLASFLVMAAPVSALTTPSVSVDDPTISEVTDYSIVFNLGVGFEFESTLTFPASSDGVVTVTAGADGATIAWPSKPIGVDVSGDDNSTPAVLTNGQSTIFTGDGTADTAGDVVLTLTAGSVAIVKTVDLTVTISEATLGGDIIIEFNEDTDIEGTLTVTVAATSGIGTDPFVPATATSAKDGQELTIVAPEPIGTGAMVEVVVSGVKNPDDPGDYTLDVSTTLEDAKTATYEIEAPDIAGLAGIVKVYNASGILMDQAVQPDAITELLEDAGPDYTIEVGPGTYVITETIEITQVGLTLKSTAGAEDTIIDASGLTATSGIYIKADDVTVDGFTVADSPQDGIVINYNTDGVTVKNNVITEANDSGIVLNYDGAESSFTLIVTGATVSGNLIQDSAAGINLLGCAKDNTISDNTITGSANESLDIHAGTTGDPTEGNTITGNIITANETMGIRLKLETIKTRDLVVFKDNLIEGNTISENEGAGIWLKDVSDGDPVPDISGFEILNNDITDNEGVGILVEAWDAANTIKFNTITGNDADNDGVGIQNDASDLEQAELSSDGDVDATFNWWGTAVSDDIADMVNDTDTSTTGGVTTYEPFLADTVAAVFSASAVAAGADSLDAKDEVGVRVSGATGATVISAAKYVANPQAAISDAIAFFDVYVVGATLAPTIKFYVGDANTEVYIWSADTETWGQLTDPAPAFSTYGGYIYVEVDEDTLGGTPFALVGVESEAGEIVAPTIDAPVSGADDISLTPTFAWSPGEDADGEVADADGYYFEFADNANFVLPLTKLDGDTGRLIVTAYAYVGELPYSTAYYWRVKAVTGTIAGGDLVEGDWASAVFITMDEPVEPTPPVEIVEASELPDIIITQPDIVIESPDIIVPLPAVVETPITPSWIYVIIGVGAVLVIALLVLIVRTRRVA